MNYEHLACMFSINTCWQNDSLYEGTMAGRGLFYEVHLTSVILI
jgi:hypothetical protein